MTLLPHPFSAEGEVLPAPEGASLAEMAGLVGDPVLRAHLVAFVDGREVAAALWADTRPRAGSHVVLRVRPSGDNGRKILRTVLQIAVIAAAAWVTGGAGGLFAAGSWQAAAAAATVTIAGNLAINALVPPPQLNLGAGEAISPTYSVDGARNAALRYQPMPVLFGEHRIFPPLQAAPWQEFIGDDVYLRYLLNLGPMPLDVDPATLKIGETPLSEFQGVEYELRLQPSDPPISLYQNDPFEDVIGADLDSGAFVSRTSQTQAMELVAVIAFPVGLGEVDDKGRNRSLSVGLEMQYRVAGSGGAWISAGASAPQANDGAAQLDETRKTVLGLFTLDDWVNQLPGSTPGLTTTVLRSEPGQSFRVVMRAAVPAGQYEVRVRRTNAAVGDNKQKFDQAVWAILRTVSDRDPLPLDNYAVMALRIKASDQLSGFIDTINMVARRRAPALAPAIASNPDADLSAVTASDWTAVAESRNPADQLLFLYRGGHTVRPRPAARINWASLAVFHRWCQDNEFTCDLVIDRPMPRAEAAQLIAACGRGRAVIINGELSVVIDSPRPGPRRQLITPRSTRGFRVRKVWTEEVHALRIPFVNREAGWREDELLVFADGYSENGEVEGTVAAERYELFRLPGRTDPDQVWRDGRFWMYTARYQTETYEWDMDAEALTSRLGDDVALAHDVMAVGLGSGRVKSLETNEGLVTGIVLDEGADETTGELVMQSGVDYGIRWRSVVSDRIHVTASLPVQTLPGPVTVLRPVEPLNPDDAPTPGDVVAFGEFERETAPVLIRRWRPGPDLGANIEAVALAPERFAADQGLVPAHDSRVTLPRVFRPPVPVLAEISATADGIYVRFDVPDGVAGQITGFRWRLRKQPEAGSDARFEAQPDLPADARLLTLPPGEPGWLYDVELIALAGEAASAPLLIAGLGPAVDIAPPANVAVTPHAFTGPSGAGVPGVRISWTPVEDPRIVSLLVYARPAASGGGGAWALIDTEPASEGAGDVRGLEPGAPLDFGLALRDRRGAATALDAWAIVQDVAIPDALGATDLNGLTRPDIEGVQAALAAALQALDDDLDAAIAAAAQSLADAEALLGNAIIAVDGRVDAANARADGIEADLRAQRAAAAEGFRALSARLAGQRGAIIADITERRAELFEQIDRIDALIVSVGDLDFDQAEAAALIATLQTVQAGIVEDVEGLLISVTSLAEDVTALQAGLTAVQQDADGNAAAIITANAAINSLDQALTQFETDLNTLTTTVTSQGQSLDEIAISVGLIQDEFEEGGRIPLAEAGITTLNTALGEVVLDLEGAVIDIIALSEAATSLNAQVNNPTTGLPAAQAAILAQSQALASLRESVVSEMRRLQARMAAAQGQALADIQIRVTELGVQIDRIDALTASLGELADDLAAAEAAIINVSNLAVANETDLEALTQTVSGQATTISGISSSVTQVINDLGAVEGDVGDLATALATADAAITTLQTTTSQIITDLDGAVQDIEAAALAITALDAQVNDPSTGLPATTAAVTSQQQAQASLRAAMAEALRAITAQLAGVRGQILSQVQLSIDERAILLSSVEALELIIGEATDAADPAGSVFARVAELAQIAVDLEANTYTLLAGQSLELRVGDVEDDVGEAGDAASPTGSIYARLANVNSIFADLPNQYFSLSAGQQLDLDVGDIEVDVTTLLQAVIDLENGKAEASALTALQIALQGEPGVSPGISAQVVTLAQALLDNSDPDNPVARAVFDILVEASGSDPAIGRWLSGPGGSEILLAARRLLFANAAGDQIYVAMEVIDQIVHIMRELRLGDDAVLTQYIGAALNIALGKDPITSKRGLFIRNNAGDPLLVANSTDQVFQVYPAMAVQGFAGAARDGFKLAHQFKPGTFVNPVPIMETFDELDLVTDWMPYNPGTRYSAVASFRMSGLANMFEWFYFEDRLILERRVGSGSPTEWAPSTEWAAYVQSYTANAGGVPGSFGDRSVDKPTQSRNLTVTGDAGSWTEIRARLRARPKILTTSWGNGDGSPFTASNYNETRTRENLYLRDCTVTIKGTTPIVTDI